MSSANSSASLPDEHSTVPVSNEATTVEPVDNETTSVSYCANDNIDNNVEDNNNNDNYQTIFNFIMKNSTRIMQMEPMRANMSKKAALNVQSGNKLKLTLNVTVDISALHVLHFCFCVFALCRLSSRS